MGVRKVGGRTLTAGFCYTDDGMQRACRWTDGNVEVLDPLDGYRASAGTGIDGTGGLLGVAMHHVADEEAQLGVLWGDGDPVELPAHIGHNVANPGCVNAGGISTGFSSHSDVPGERMPVFWYEGDCILQRIPEQYSKGVSRDVNDKNYFVGNVHNSEAEASSCIWFRGKGYLLELPHVGSACRIDNNGVVAGWWDASDGEDVGDEPKVQPWLWRLNTGAADLGTSVPPVAIDARFQSLAEDISIDRAGTTNFVVVNVKEKLRNDREYFMRPYLFRFNPETLEIAEGPIDLNELVKLPSGWSDLEIVTGIWDGSIVGVGTWRDLPQAFALHPEK